MIPAMITCEPEMPHILRGAGSRSPSSSDAAMTRGVGGARGVR